MNNEKLKVGKYVIEVSNLSKIMYPDQGLIKEDLIEYYRKIGGTMLYHVKDRPITMQRFPDGIKKKEFYQKEVPDYFPDWIKQTSVRVKEEKSSQHQVVCNNTATLVYLANQACITPHIWLSRSDKLVYPDKLIFDLDPPGKDFETVREAAQYLRKFLEEIGLTAYVMTTGSRGLHVVCPLDRSAKFNEARTFAQKISAAMTDRYPEILTTEYRKKERRGRVFVDYLRNAYAQTSVAPYALRTLKGAPVATPITWDELADKKAGPQIYNIGNIFRRLGQMPDPWKNMMRHAISLSAARARLKNMAKHEE